MNTVMMALGDYRFSIDSAAFDSLQKTASYRWQAQERLLRRPALQYLGLGEEAVSLSGVIYPHYRGGLDQVETMRSEAEKGEPLALVDGMGNYWGRFVISQIGETRTVFFADSAPRCINFTMELKRYGEDDDASEATVDAGTGDAWTVVSIQDAVIAAAGVGDGGLLSGLADAFGADDASLANAAATISQFGVDADAAVGIVNQLLGVGARICSVAGLPISVADSSLSFVPGSLSDTSSGLAMSGCDAHSIANAFLASPLDGITALASAIATSDDPDAFAQLLLPGSGGSALAALAKSLLAA